MPYRDPGRQHFVCLNCRRSVKLLPDWQLLETGEDRFRAKTRLCTACQRPMVCLGRKFTPPRKTNDAAWQRLEWLIEAGWRGGSWGTKPEMSLRDLKEKVAERRRRAAEIGPRNHRPVKPLSPHQQRRLERLQAQREARELKRQKKYQEAALAVALAD